MRRTLSMLAAACALVVGMLWAVPAWGADTVPGYGVERVSVLPSRITPGSTISLNVDLSQTTPYPIGCRPSLTLLFSPVTVVGPVDISVRAMNPHTGIWSYGVEETYPYADSSEQVSFAFPDSFELAQTEQLTLHYQITFGADAPVGWYTAFLGVSAIPLGGEPGLGVAMESVNEIQYFQVGMPPTAEPPQAPPPPAPPRVTTQPPTLPATPPATAPATATPGTTGVAPSLPPVVAAHHRSSGVSSRVVLAAAAAGVGWILLAAGYTVRVRRRRAIAPIDESR